MRGIKRLFLLLGTVLIFYCIPGVKAEAAADYIHQEFFSSDYELQGLFASCSQNFYAGEWNIHEVKLTLYYTATMLVREEISDFTVSVNGQPVFSGRVPLTGGETQRVDISIPSACIREGSNQISIESYIRTNDEDPCKDDVSGASWMVILKESVITVKYTPSAKCTSIADIYKKLTSIEALENEESGIAVPQAASDAELTASAYAMTGIAANAVLFYENMDVIFCEESRETNKQYLLYISSYDHLDPELTAGMSREQKTAAENGAAMIFLPDRNGKSCLLITGSDSRALINACRLLGNKDYMQQMSVSWKKVGAEDNVVFDYDEEKESVLTESGSYVNGPFSQSASFYIECAADRRITSGSEVTLRFRYAENLDFDRALVTVYINDTPLGSKKLSRETANGDVFTVPIPRDLGIAGNFNLKVTFDLEIPDMVCTMRRQDMPWAYITKESTIRLKTEEIPYLLFDYYPTPFLVNGRLNQVMVVIPAEESKQDREIFGKVLLTLGRFQKDNKGSITVCRADHMGSLENMNIISIGTLEKNPIARHCNDQLYFRFSPKGTTILSNEKMQLDPDYAASLGTAQLIYSPYSSEKYGLLLISGITESGMESAGKYLGSVEENWKVYGDGFVSDSENIYCYRFGEDNGKRNSLLTKMTSQDDILIFSVIGGCVLFLLVITAALLMKKYGKK